MKKGITITSFFVCVTTSLWAQQPPRLPYSQQLLDSLFQQLPRRSQSYTMPLPKIYSMPPYNNEGLSATPHNVPQRSGLVGATIINKTSRGTVYNALPDNMAVLVPDMQQIEKMPGSKAVYKPAPPSNMPNPFFPGNMSKTK